MDIIPAPKKNIVMDATLLSSLMACPRMTNFRFNLRLTSINGKSNSLECGSIVHKVLETFYKLKIQGMNREQCIAYGMAAGELYIRGCPHCTDFVPSNDFPKPPCGHPVNEFPGVKNTPPESTTSPSRIGWKWALQTCEEYFAHYINDYWVPLEVEVIKSKVLYQDDEIRILWKAKLDWVVDTNQGIYSVDHKTMKQRRDTNSMNNQFMGQCHIMGTRNVIINKIGFQTTLKAAEKFTRPMVSYSADRLIEWQSEILPFYAYQMLSYNEADHWPPNFNNCENKYSNCVFYEGDVCTSDRGMREQNLKLNFYVGPEWNPSNEEEA